MDDCRLLFCATTINYVDRQVLGILAPTLQRELGWSEVDYGSAVAEWFPKRERALAIGIFNAGTNVGAIIAPLIVPWIALPWGWRWAFIATGAIGFVWLVF